MFRDYTRILQQIVPIVKDMTCVNHPQVCLDACHDFNGTGIGLMVYRRKYPKDHLAIKVNYNWAIKTNMDLFKNWCDWFTYDAEAKEKTYFEFNEQTIPDGWIYCLERRIVIECFMSDNGQYWHSLCVYRDIDSIKDNLVGFCRDGLGIIFESLQDTTLHYAKLGIDLGRIIAKFISVDIIKVTMEYYNYGYANGILLIPRF